MKSSWLRTAVSAAGPIVSILAVVFGDEKNASDIRSDRAASPSSTTRWIAALKCPPVHRSIILPVLTTSASGEPSGRETCQQTISLI